MMLKCNEEVQKIPNSSLANSYSFPPPNVMLAQKVKYLFPSHDDGMQGSHKESSPLC